MTAFERWVATSIDECGGSGIAYLNECNESSSANDSHLEVCQSLFAKWRNCWFIAQSAYPVLCNDSAH